MTATAPSRRNISTLTEASEKMLVDAARQHDEAAIRELVRRMNPRLFRVARGLATSDAEAEEIVQEAYLAAFTKLDSFREEARFSTWITRITLNAAKMRARRARPQEEYDTVNETRDPTETILPFPSSRSDQPEAILAQHQVRALLERAVAELPSDLRLVFLMREAEGMSTLAIARDLSLNPITVKTRLFRARQRLRRMIEQRLRGGFDAIFPFDGARCNAMADRVVAALREK